MKLIDLLKVLDDDCTVYVWAYSANDPDSDTLVSMRTETDNIDPKFNNCTVDYVAPTANDSIDINIDYIAFAHEALEVYE